MAKEPQLVTPMEKLEALTGFEGRQVIGVGVEIPGAGGGLRDALTVDPQEFHYGETVFVVVEGRVGKLRFDPVKDAGDVVRRVHVLDVVGAVIVERATVEALLEAQAIRIEEARGLARLPFEPTDEELLTAHNNGEHADGLVGGCVECEREKDLALQESDADDLSVRRAAAKKTTAKKAAAKKPPTS